MAASNLDTTPDNVSTKVIIMKKSIVFLSALLMSGFLFAAPEGRQPMGEGMGGHGGMGMHQRPDLSELNLSEEQQVQLKSLREKHRADMKALHEKHQAEIRAIMSEEQWQKFEAMRPKVPHPGKKGRMMSGSGAMEN